MEQIHLKLSTEDVNKILNSLAKEPYSEVHNLYVDINNQAVESVNKTRTQAEDEFRKKTVSDYKDALSKEKERKLTAKAIEEETAKD